MIQFIKNLFNQKSVKGLEPEYDKGDFYKLEVLVKKLKSGRVTEITTEDLQLQANYPKRLEYLLKSNLK